MSNEKALIELVAKSVNSNSHLGEDPDFETSLKRGACTAIEIAVPLVATTILAAALNSIFTAPSSSSSSGETY